jgi:hypothetical protein
MEKAAHKHIFEMFGVNYQKSKIKINSSLGKKLSETVFPENSEQPATRDNLHGVNSNSNNNGNLINFNNDIQMEDREK